jgi:hypothetical protein
MAKNDTNESSEEDVEVEVTGGMRRAAVAVEAVVVPLRDKAGTLSGSKKIELEPPVVTMTATLKGGLLAKYDIAVTINGVTKHSKGTIRDGIEQVKENWPFSAFKLEP